MYSEANQSGGDRHRKGSVLQFSRDGHTLPPHRGHTATLESAGGRGGQGKTWARASCGFCRKEQAEQGKQLGGGPSESFPWDLKLGGRPGHLVPDPGVMRTGGQWPSVSEPCGSSIKAGVGV